MDIFQEATKRKIRFDSVRGELTTEQLWDLPLTSRRDDFDLDSVAKTVNAQLKSVTEESFVKVKQSKARELHELQLEIVKHVIADKIAQDEQKRSAVEKAAKREKLMAILESKENEALSSQSVEDIRKQLAELAE